VSPRIVSTEILGLTRLILRSILTSVHHDTAACAVFAQEHLDDAFDLPTAASPPEWFPWGFPLSGTAATPHPLSSPPFGGDISPLFLQNPLNSDEDEEDVTWHEGDRWVLGCWAALFLPWSVLERAIARRPLT
jgi:hypothetical protein